MAVRTDSIIRNNFLYRSWDGFPNVMRMIVRLTEEVSVSDLEEAVRQARIRFPYLCKKVIREGGMLKIVSNDADIPVYDAAQGITLGGDGAFGHFIAVGYEGDSIYFDLYHNLCDGMGSLPWIRTVLYLYLNRMHGGTLSPEGFMLPGEEIPSSEYEDPYADLVIEDDPKPLWQRPDTKAFVPDDRYITEKVQDNFLIRASEEDMIRLSKSDDGSPVSLSAFFLKETIKKLFPDRGGKPIVCEIPHSLRTVNGHALNYHDQVKLVFITYPDKMEAMSFDRQLTCSRAMLTLQMDEDNMLCAIREYADFACKIDSLKSDRERRDAFKESIGTYLDDPNTVGASYLGRCDWGSISPYILEVFPMCGVLGATIMLEIVPLNGHMFISFMQKGRTEKYAETFVEILREYGVKADIVNRTKQRFASVYIPIDD